MLIGLMLCTTAMVIIIQKIANTDRSNKEILTIFALLSLEEIDRIYGICDKYIDRIDNHYLMEADLGDDVQQQTSLNRDDSMVPINKIYRKKLMKSKQK